ncbi:zf-MYND type zinc finger protein [Schizosaccharomyces japonicus yFS275]|uniref:Zf-MYND type zinc finger protein n=1 Tax=Schizosaccharomyces japonicus (strain yFS275 / FY16936) TaxID=402676 RepID=B6JWY5_SCHJY|nr:zf-MYND type zinc finger protein [Schizosaccharomyces japonicus yFS275]EEB05886.1 zf-MYND type zinc finger protein [Schizosaccharomyces japonicus yFS275]
MRESNISVVWSNKASVTINTVLYDRRALDCDSEMALMNSLSHLAYLTSTSPKIREILTVDGGLMRLVNILRSGRGQSFTRMTIWQLALQCVVNVGIRGSEAIRMQVVKAGVIPVIVTLLDDFLSALEFFVPQHTRPYSSALNSPLSSAHSSAQNLALLNANSLDISAAQNVERLSDGTTNGTAHTADMGSGDEMLPRAATPLRDETGQADTPAQMVDERLSNTVLDEGVASNSAQETNPPADSTRNSLNRSVVAATAAPVGGVVSAAPASSLPSETQRRLTDQHLFAAVQQQQVFARRHRRPQFPVIANSYTEARRLAEVLSEGSVPSFLEGSEKKLNRIPREEDILFGLQLLAYTSKNYFQLRHFFEASRDVPALRMTNTYNTSKTWNTFQLVEQFTLQIYPPQVQYWASAIMYNYCRKDESNGGIRRCANLMCDKWEEHNRQFAKCRRCRRTKYCSKRCQHQAWPGHRRWCKAIVRESRSSKTSSNATASQTTTPSTNQQAAPLNTEMDSVVNGTGTPASVNATGATV